jgi:hypothetical protein
MGAATALLHTHRDPSIAAMVLDSPFADLKQLCMELVEMGKAKTGYRCVMGAARVYGGGYRCVRPRVVVF